MEYFPSLVFPFVKSIENDDFEGDTRASQVSIRLPENGRYRIVTTSYSSGETGQFNGNGHRARDAGEFEEC